MRQGTSARQSWLGLALALLGLCMGSRPALAQSIPAVPPPTCVAAFCPPGSLHPNMSIPCSSSGCECWDSCGGGSGSASRSGSSAGLSRALTAAVVAAAKAAFLIAAPGHASESFGRSGETQAQAGERYRSYERERQAQARRGAALAGEAESFRRFQQAILRRERDAHRHLRPLFQATPLGPPMSRRDSLAQLRCVQAALSSASEALRAGVPGDISFLEARQAADIAAGAWDSGRAPSDCAGSPSPPRRSPFFSYTPEQKQRFLIELGTQLQSTLEAQRDLDQQEAELQKTQQRLAEQRKKLLAEQEEKQRAAAIVAQQAEQQAQEQRRALEQALAVEPPPAPLRPSKPSPPPPTPAPSSDPEDDLLLRLQRAKEQADAQVEATGRALQQVQDEAARQSQRFERSAEAQLKEQEGRLRRLSEQRGQTLGALNQDFELLGLPPIALPPGAASGSAAPGRPASGSSEQPVKTPGRQP